MLRLLPLLLLVCTYAFGQFKPSAIGAYLPQEGANSYSLTIVFSPQMLSEPLSDLSSNIGFSGSLELFDDKGELYTIHGPFNFKIHQWCENDGGIQHRPTVQLSIDKTKLKRKLAGNEAIQNIACFVVANPSTKVTSINAPPTSEKVVLNGDFDNDGKFDCLISTFYDDAENCAGQPANNLGINLHVNGVTYSLRCCGP